VEKISRPIARHGVERGHLCARLSDSLHLWPRPVVHTGFKAKVLLKVAQQ
jgi:hypothetical protein